MLGFMFHMLYLVFLMYYVDDVYINNNPKFPTVESMDLIPINNDAVWLIIAILYPIIYEFVEMYSSGMRLYFTSKINVNNQFFIWLSVLNAILQINNNPFLFSSRLIFVIVIFFSIVRTFEFMRIFILYSPVV